MRPALVHFVLAAGLVLVMLAVASAAAPPLAEVVRLDACGDPLPADALARFGTTRFRDNGFFRYSALSADGKLLASSGEDEIRFVDPATGKEARRITARTGTFRSGSLTFSPNGKHIALCNNNSVVVCDVVKAEVLSQFRPSTHAGYSTVSFSQDGKLLAVGGSGSHRPYSATIWSVIEKKEKRKIEVGYNQKVSAMLSPDGKVLATWGQCGDGLAPDSVLELWDTDTGKQRLRLENKGSLIEWLVFSPDGKQMAVGDFLHPTSIRDVATGKVLREFATTWRTSAVAYSPDGRWLVTGAGNGIVQLWDARSGKRLGWCPAPRQTSVLSFAFLPGNKILAAGYSHQMLRLWDVPFGREQTTVKGHLASVQALAFSRDGKTLFSAGNDGVRVHALESGKEVRQLDPPHDDYEGRVGMYWSATDECLLSPDARYVLWCNKRINPRLRVVELSSAKVIADLPTRNDLYGVAGSFAPDGTAFASLSQEMPGKKPQTVAQIWDLASGRQIARTHIAEDFPFWALALSPGGKMLAAANNYLRERKTGEPTRLWDLPAGKEKLRLPFRLTRSMMFSPDGSLLATSEVGVIGVWDTNNGQRILDLEGKRGYRRRPIAFSPDVRLLTVAGHGPDGESEEIRLCELASGKVRVKFPGHRGGTLCLAFSPDGHTLASGGVDTTVMLWDVTGVAGLGRQRRSKPTVAEVAVLWDDLNNADASKAHKAMARLISAPAESLALFRKELQSASERSTPETLRAKRAVEILERLATPEARRLLQALAKGNPTARLTSDAASTLKRLQR